MFCGSQAKQSKESSERRMTVRFLVWFVHLLVVVVLVAHMLLLVLCRIQNFVFLGRTKEQLEVQSCHGRISTAI